MRGTAPGQTAGRREEPETVPRLGNTAPKFCSDAADASAKRQLSSARPTGRVDTCSFVLSPGSLDELVSLGTLTVQAARFLEAAVIAGLNIVVAGGTQAGKPTSRQDTV